MIENCKKSLQEFRDYDSDLLLDILNNTSVEKKIMTINNYLYMKIEKINSKNMDNKIPFR